MLHYARMGLLYPYLILICVFIHGLVIVRPFHKHNMSFISKLLSRGSLFILGAKIKIEGEEYLYPDEPSVLICNHQHTLDIFICTGFLKRNAVTLGKKQLVYIPIFGWAYYLVGNILIERHNREKAVAALQKVASKMKKRGTSILVFPEGTRNWGKFLPFKSGAFNVAIAGKSPIIPIVVQDYNDALDLNKIRSGTIHVKVLPPISTENLDLKKDAKPLAANCQRTMEEVHQQLSTKNRV